MLDADHVEAKCVRVLEAGRYSHSGLKAGTLSLAFLGLAWHMSNSLKPNISAIRNPVLGSFHDVVCSHAIDMEQRATICAESVEHREDRAQLWGLRAHSESQRRGPRHFSEVVLLV